MLFACQDSCKVQTENRLACEVLKRLDMVSEFLPDLILKDIELTDTDGFEI